MRSGPVGTGLIMIGIAAGVVAGCGTSSYPPEVTSALDAAGSNRGELESVLRHYADSGDTLKLKAAYYLVGNMGSHCYSTYALKDTAGTEISFSALDYPDYETLLTAFDSLEDRHGVLDFERKDKIEDVETATADFLITQINFAFRAWRERPWAGSVTFEDFCSYVLPFRGSNEPLEPWREVFFEKYAGIAESLSDPSDPIEAATFINDDIKSWFGFDPRYYYHPTDQGLSEMLAGGLGRCEDMTNITIYAMRANGLAVTSDYTPHWADAGNNHAWNAIVTADGVIPFMGAESNPGQYRLANKSAKVYRKMFAVQPDNLTFQVRRQDKIPGWLAGENCIDVTADYQDVCDVTVTFGRDIPDSIDIAYLCVFNSGEWKAVHWAKIADKSACYTDMGRDIAYLPALYINEEIVPWGAPFILQTDCSLRPLIADIAKLADVHLVSTTRHERKESIDGIAGSSLTPGRTYELFYLADGWHSLGKRAAGDGSLRFENVPSEGLYWLVAEDSDREERIFTLEDDRQVWW